MFCQIVSDVINNRSSLGIQKPSFWHSMTVSMATIVPVIIGNHRHTDTSVSNIFQSDWIWSNYHPQVFLCRNEKSLNFYEVDIKQEDSLSLQYCAR